MIYTIGLLLIEILHIKEHTLIALNFRKYSSLSLAQKRWYFIVDWLTAFLSYLHIGMPIGILPITFFHFVAHLFYVTTWKNGYYSIRIRNWSSKDKFTKHFTFDLLLTCLDILNHSIMVFYLMNQLY